MIKLENKEQKNANNVLTIHTPSEQPWELLDTVTFKEEQVIARFEGIIIGIELHRTFPCCGDLKPNITLLHDGYITDGFKPNDLRQAGRSALAQKGE